MKEKPEILRRFDHWLFESFSLSPEAWGLFRIAYAAYMLVWVGLPELGYLADLPDAFFHPPRFSIGALFPGFPGAGFLLVTGLLTAAAFLCILFGFHTRIASVSAVILYVCSKNLIYGTGQINHDFMVWLVPLAGAFANWGARYSIDARGRPPSPATGNEGWPVTFLVVIFCFALALSGYNKLLGGWADPELPAVQQWHARMFVVIQRDALLSPVFQELNGHLFWKCLDYLTLGFEMGIIAGVLYPRIFRSFLFMAVCFHATILLMINIDFSFNFAFYALFLDWDRVHRWLENHSRLTKGWRRGLRWPFILPASLAFLVFFGITESSVVGFILELCGIGYLGDALFRTLFGASIAAWALYTWARTRVGVPATTVQPAYDSQRLNNS